jgi:hypothetical protein
MGWTPALIREGIESYGEARPSQQVTFDGVATDISQRTRVDRWPTNDPGCFGEIRFDLNIDGEAPDLTESFALSWVDDGAGAILDDIRVM